MGHEPLVQRLLERGACPDARSLSGRTPLMMAVVSPNGLATARALLNAGADVTAVDAAGESAFDFARLEGSVEMIQLLTEATNKACPD
jgi:ankyrin repeat protein